MLWLILSCFLLVGPLVEKLVIMKINIKKTTNRQLRHVASLAMVLAGAIAASSCEKDAEDIDKQITVSLPEDIEEPISVWDLDVKGGRDTVYVFTNSEIAVQLEGIDGWLSVVGQEYVPNMQATRLIVESEPMEEDFLQRSGILNISTQEQYSRFFLKVTQGYLTRFADDFAWLRYGNGNPLDLTSGVLFEGWNPTQIATGWTAPIAEGQERAYVYGKNGYIQLGAEEHGAAFASPIVPEIQRDSILMLSFNGVAYTSSTGQADANKLTVSLVGGEFEDGASQKVIELGYYDKGSPLINTKMWDNSLYNFVVHKPALNPNASTIQVKFSTGEQIAEPENRVFIDNVRIYRVSQFEPEPVER